MGSLISFCAGVIVSSIVWFFVWRNNKKAFEAKIEALSNMIPTNVPKV